MECMCIFYHLNEIIRFYSEMNVRESASLAANQWKTYQYFKMYTINFCMLLVNPNVINFTQIWHEIHWSIYYFLFSIRFITHLLSLPLSFLPPPVSLALVVNVMIFLHEDFFIHIFVILQ